MFSIEIMTVLDILRSTLRPGVELKKLESVGWMVSNSTNLYPQGGVGVCGNLQTPPPDLFMQDNEIENKSTQKNKECIIVESKSWQPMGKVNLEDSLLTRLGIPHELQVNSVKLKFMEM